MGFIFKIHSKDSACIVTGTSCIGQYLLYNHKSCLLLYLFCEFLGYFFNVCSIFDDILHFWQMLRLVLSFLFLNPQYPRFSWLLYMFSFGVLFFRHHFFYFSRAFLFLMVSLPAHTWQESSRTTFIDCV